MIYPNSQVDYRLYKNGTALPGVVKVSMPSIKYKTVDVTGAGVMGTFTVPLAAMIDAMSITIEFSSHDAMVELGENQWQDISLWEAEQYFDGVQRTEELRPERFELSVRPTETSMGDIEAFTAHNVSATYSVAKYAVYVDNEEKIYIDQLNLIHRVNGTDNAAKVREAIGMT